MRAKLAMGWVAGDSTCRRPCRVVEVGVGEAQICREMGHVGPH